LAGKTVTLSFYARAGANYSAASNILFVQLLTATGVDQNTTNATGITIAGSGNSTLTATWQRFSFTISVPSTSTQLFVRNSFTPTGTAGANDYFEITGVQLELGSTATPFSRAGGSIGGELALCQRYLPSYNGGAAMGYAYGTNSALYCIPFPVQARVAPTGITVVSNPNAYSLNTGTSVAPTFDLGGIDSCDVLASLTITAGQGSRLMFGKLLFTGCEL